MILIDSVIDTVILPLRSLQTLHYYYYWTTNYYYVSVASDEFVHPKKQLEEIQPKRFEFFVVWCQ